MVREVWQGGQDIKRGLVKFYKLLRETASFHKWCGEYIVPHFFDQMSEYYVTVHVASLYSKKKRNKPEAPVGFVIWSDEAGFQTGDDLVLPADIKNKRGELVDKDLLIPLSVVSEILVWCSTTHAAGQILLRAVKEFTRRRRVLVAECHEERSREAYREAGFVKLWSRPRSSLSSPSTLSTESSPVESKSSTKTGSSKTKKTMQPLEICVWVPPDPEFRRSLSSFHGTHGPGQGRVQVV